MLKNPSENPERAALRLGIVLEFLEFARAFGEDRAGDGARLDSAVELARLALDESPKCLTLAL